MLLMQLRWVALLIATCLCVGCAEKPGETASDRDVSAPLAPDFTLLSTDLETVQFTDYRGKVVILDFWATWCTPCRVEIPHFVELYETYQSQGLEIVGISLDQEGLAVVEPFMEELGINYTILLGEPELLQLYEVPVIPTAFLIDREGRIVNVFHGVQGKDAYEQALAPLL